MKFSYHNHTTYSDGTISPEKMIEAAHAAGFTSYAFTDHIFAPQGGDWTLNPGSYEQYVSHIRGIKEEYRGRIDVFTGIEADWYKGIGTGASRYEDIKDELDFVAGAVHWLNPNGQIYLIDSSLQEYRDCLNKEFGGSFERMITFYYESYMEMVETLRPNLAVHVDLMLKNNRDPEVFFYREDWYALLMERVAKCLKTNGVMSEVNGGGNYRYRNGIIYPAKYFLDVMNREQVPFTIGLDAHAADMLTSYYRQSIDYLKESGIDTLHYFMNGCWEQLPIDSCCQS